MSQNTANNLFKLLSVRNFGDLQALDSATNKPAQDDQGRPDVGQADMFTFDWTAQSGQDYGTVVILLNRDSGLDVFFGDNMGRTMESQDKQEWFDFLNQLRQFATKNFLEFSPRNLNKLRFSLAGQAAIQEGLFESWVGNATTSWNGSPTQARLMVRHKKRMAEGDARYRYIDRMFVETAEGERYRLPFTRLSGGRAMVEHVRQGGKPYDLRGQHIVGMVEELNVLSRFRRANLGRVFEGNTQDLVAEANTYYENLNGVMKALSKPQGYQAYFENWKPEEITAQDMVIEDIKTLFIEQNLDSRIEAALPILARIQQGTNMKEAQIFESWVNGMMEGTWALPDTPGKREELIKLLSAEFPVGPDATNATEQLYDLVGDDDLFDSLEELADTDANADARHVIISRLMQLRDHPDVAPVLTALGDQEQDMAEGSIRGGVWTADPPDPGKPDVPPPSPDEGPTLKMPAPKPATIKPAVPKPAPKAPVKTGELDVDGGVGMAENAQSQPMEKEYQAYDDTLAQILRHAGVDDHNTPAPDYETGVMENSDNAWHRRADPLWDVLARFPYELRKYKLTTELDDDLYHALYDYYLNSGQMPYGVAKARDGDPTEWVGNRLDQWLETGRDYASEDKLETPAVPVPANDVTVDESVCNMTAEGEYCPEHGLEECGMYEGDYGLTLAPTAESVESDLARMKKLALGK